MLQQLLFALAIVVVILPYLLHSSFRMHLTTYKNSARSQVGMLTQAVKLYELRVGSLPTNAQGLDALLAAPADLSADEKAKWDGPYLDKLQLPVDPWNNPYRYCRISAKEFRIWSRGPDGLSGTRDDITLKSS